MLAFHCTIPTDWSRTIRGEFTLVNSQCQSYMDCPNLFPNNVMVDSKDAKAKIHADVSPVQKPGKRLRKIPW